MEIICVTFRLGWLPGLTAKTIELLVATYALRHSVALLTGDSAFLGRKHAGRNCCWSSRRRFSGG